MTSYSYESLYSATNRGGDHVPSRLGMTRELVGESLVVEPGRHVTRPGLHRPLGYAELLQLVGGVFDRDALVRVAPRADHSLFTEQMAYGPRMFVPRALHGPAPFDTNQVAWAIRELREHPESRRAVVYVGDPWDPPHERPCTEVVQFLRRPGGTTGTLTTLVSMRSWDLWYGLPYDLTMFGGLALLVAHCLGTDAGVLRVTAGSAHVYERHWDRVVGTSQVTFCVDRALPTEWVGISQWARDLVPTYTTGVPDGLLEVGAVGADPTTPAAAPGAAVPDRVVRAPR
jgi:hypothetical protein